MSLITKEEVDRMMAEQREHLETMLEEEKKRTEKERMKRKELEKEKNQLEMLVESLQDRYNKQDKEHRERYHKIEDRMNDMMERLTNAEKSKGLEGAVGGDSLDGKNVNERFEDMDEKKLEKAEDLKLSSSTPKRN